MKVLTAAQIKAKEKAKEKYEKRLAAKQKNLSIKARQKINKKERDRHISKTVVVLPKISKLDKLIYQLETAQRIYGPDARKTNLIKKQILIEEPAFFADLHKSRAAQTLKEFNEEIKVVAEERNEKVAEYMDHQESQECADPVVQAEQPKQHEQAAPQL